MSNTFDASIRSLLCARCGAPLQVPLAGGRVTCAYCRTSAEIGSARVDPLHLAAIGGPELDEAARERARLISLRAQAATYNSSTNIYAFYEAPPGLEHFDAIAEDDPGKLHLLHQAFVDASRRCEATSGSLGVQRHVYWLARKLLQMHTHAQDMGRGRVYLETSRELLTDPGYQQLLRCAMANLARDGGDLAAAEAWLATCDPHPALLDLDSDYRTSRARIAIQREEWTAVLDLVGETHASQPFEPSSVPQVTLFRVLALAATGAPSEAEAELRWLAEQIDREFLRAWIERMPYLAPCRAVWARCGFPGEPEPEPPPPDEPPPPPAVPALDRQASRPALPELAPPPDPPATLRPALRGLLVASLFLALLVAALALVVLP